MEKLLQNKNIYRFICTRISRMVILFVYIFGPFFEKELLALEGSIQFPLFTWGLRIFMAMVVIIILKERKIIHKLVNKKNIMVLVYLILIIGSLGWVTWGLSLFL